MSKHHGSHLLGINVRPLSNGSRGRQSAGSFDLFELNEGRLNAGNLALDTLEAQACVGPFLLD